MPTPIAAPICQWLPTSYTQLTGSCLAYGYQRMMDRMWHSRCMVIPMKHSLLGSGPGDPVFAGLEPGWSQATFSGHAPHAVRVALLALGACNSLALSTALHLTVQRSRSFQARRWDVMRASSAARASRAGRHRTWIHG